jgi:hypothetical protein
MAALVYLLTSLGALASANGARRLRTLSRVAQPLADGVMLVAASVLVLEGLQLHVLDWLLLR